MRLLTYPLQRTVSDILTVKSSSNPESAMQFHQLKELTDKLVLTLSQTTFEERVKGFFEVHCRLPTNNVSPPALTI